MALYQAPSFEALEMLSRSRDADLARRELLHPDRVRGRGAQSNRSGRFETHTRENMDDGWSNIEPVPVFETVEHVERAKSIITSNDSPDIGFERSINAYRGCEHGCSYCYARPSHAFLGHSAGVEFERDIYVKVNAVETLRAAAADVIPGDPILTLWTNHDGSMVSDGRQALDLLVGQVASPVRWDRCMAAFAAEGVTGIIELAPGGTLVGLAKRGLKGVPTVAIKTPDDLGAAVELLGGTA